MKKNKTTLKTIIDTFRNNRFNIVKTSDSITEIEKNRQPYNFYERLQQAEPIIIKKSDYIKRYICKDGNIVGSNDYEQRYNKLKPINFFSL